MDKVSIIMPVYNNEETLEACLESILNQTYKNIELIVINDGSTDRTEEILKHKLQDSNIGKWISIHNQGVSHARNVGIKESTGKYIMFIDADDKYLPNAVKTMVENLQENDILIASYRRVYNDNSTEEIKLLQQEGNNSIEKNINYLHSKKALKVLWNKIFRTDIIKNNSIFMNEELKNGEDYVFVIDYLEYVQKIKIIDEIIYEYKIHSSGLSSDPEQYKLERRLYTLTNHKNMYERRNFSLKYIKKQYIISFYAYIFNQYSNRKHLSKYEKESIIKEALLNSQIQEYANSKENYGWKINILAYFIKKHYVKCIRNISELILWIKMRSKIYKNKYKL